MLVRRAWRGASFVWAHGMSREGSKRAYTLLYLDSNLIMWMPAALWQPTLSYLCKNVWLYSSDSNCTALTHRQNVWNTYPKLKRLSTSSRWCLPAGHEWRNASYQDHHSWMYCSTQRFTQIFSRISFSDLSGTFRWQDSSLNMSGFLWFRLYIYMIIFQRCKAVQSSWLRNMLLLWMLQSSESSAPQSLEPAQHECELRQTSTKPLKISNLLKLNWISLDILLTSGQPVLATGISPWHCRLLSFTRVQQHSIICISYLFLLLGVTSWRNSFLCQHYLRWGSVF